MGYFTEPKGGVPTDTVPREKRAAAFIAVSVTALLIPLFGAAAIIAFIPAVAACVAAVRSAAKYMYLIPGVAGAIGICFALDMSLPLYGSLIAASLVCGVTLGTAIRRGADATGQTVAATVAIIVLSASLIAAFSYSYYGSLGDALSAAYTAAVDLLSQGVEILDRAAERYAAYDPQAASSLDLSVITGLDADEVARAVMLSLPGFFVAVSFVLGWVFQLFARVFLMIFARRDLIPKERRLTVPVSAAAIFFALDIVAYFSSGDSLFTICASNVVNALYPVMAIVGAGFFLDIVRRSRSRFSVMFVIVFAISAFIMPTVFVSVLSIAGALGTVMRAIGARRSRNE